MQPGTPAYGDLTLATDASTSDAELSWQQYWFRGVWFDSLEVYWKDFTTPGAFRNRTYAPDKAGSDNEGMLAVHVRLAPGETRKIRFVIAWSFPTCENYWKREELVAEGIDPTWQNYYATQWADSQASAQYALARLGPPAGRDAACSKRRCLPPRCPRRPSTPSPATWRSSSRRPCCAWRMAPSTAGRAATRRGLLRRLLHARVELPADAALPVPGARTLDAHGGLPLQPAARWRHALPHPTAARLRPVGLPRLRRRTTGRRAQDLPRLEDLRRPRVAAQPVAGGQAVARVCLVARQRRPLGPGA